MKKGGFFMNSNKTKQIVEHSWLEQEVLHAVVSVENALKLGEIRRGISVFSANNKKDAQRKKFSVRGRDGKNALTISKNYTSFRLETPTVKVDIQYDVATKFSELGANGVWNTSTYSEKGKQIDGYPLAQYSRDEGTVIAKNILSNIFDKTLPNMTENKDLIHLFKKDVQNRNSGLFSELKDSYIVRIPPIRNA
jgi:hypothetical protein